MGRRALQLVKGGAIALTSLALLVFVAAFIARGVTSANGPDLEPWHTFVPRELTVAEMGQSDWAGYLAEEARIFAEMKNAVTDRLPALERTPINRYFAGSRVYPPRFAQDWNRSFEIAPEGPVRGAAVFLHGLTDSPYSLRHVARRYSALGYLSIGIRLPGHGTTPGALTDVEVKDWIAASRLAVREARKRVGPDAPIHLVGYSNGAALALMYALDALDDDTLVRPARLVLLSPMIAITPFARFVGLAGLPAVVPAFAKAAWLSIEPEFNPFKYNSFPVNAARQSYLLTQELAANIQRHLTSGKIANMPPVLAFQSVLDETVSAPAVLTGLFAHLPENGSELVLFDLNRTTDLDLVLTRNTLDVLDSLLPDADRSFHSTLVTNIPGQAAVQAQTKGPHATNPQTLPLNLTYEPNVYSLSHIAVPFPLADGLYGMTPDPADAFGINLGTITGRGERGALVLSLDILMRMSSNPFFPYLLERVETAITAPKPAAAAPR